MKLLWLRAMAASWGKEDSSSDLQHRVSWNMLNYHWISRLILNLRFLRTHSKVRTPDIQILALRTIGIWILIEERLYTYLRGSKGYVSGNL